MSPELRNAGLAGGLLGPLELRLPGVNAGRNSDLSIYKSLNTRLSNGNISTFNPVYGFRGGFAQGIVGIPGAGIGAVAMTYYPQQPNGN